MGSLSYEVACRKIFPRALDLGHAYAITDIRCFVELLVSMIATARCSPDAQARRGSTSLVPSWPDESFVHYHALYNKRQASGSSRERFFVGIVGCKGTRVCGEGRSSGV